MKGLRKSAMQKGSQSENWNRIWNSLRSRPVITDPLRPAECSYYRSSVIRAKAYKINKKIYKCLCILRIVKYAYKRIM